MGIPILIIGESGTGKSTSIRNLTNAGIINVYGKPLPFRSNMKTVSIDDCNKIISLLNKVETDVVVIDDFQYLLVNQFMNRAMEKGYDKFTEMAKGYYDVINAVRKLPAQKRVYFLSHSERDNFGNVKAKTIGKLLDEKVTVEGLFTIVLRTMVTENNYYFQTRNSGQDTVKSPMDMFTEDLIPNDLAEVDRAVCEYYNLTPAPPAPPARNTQQQDPTTASKAADPNPAQAPAGNQNGGA
ncbi:ATP-binding protein [Spirochaetia bacterium]|nr:ATP-binding protein [Spirochaetia bacterium]